MDVREKLVELIGQVQDCGCDVTDVVEMNYVENIALADHLVANGVTVQKWISVKDRLPTEEAKAYEKEWEDYPDFLVMIEGAYLPTKLYYDWENNEWFKINTALKREKYKVTHWMDMPQPPKGD